MHNHSYTHVHSRSKLHVDNFVYEMKGANGAHMKNMKCNKIKVHHVIDLDIALHIDILCNLDQSMDSVNLVIDNWFAVLSTIMALPFRSILKTLTRYH